MIKAKEAISLSKLSKLDERVMELISQAVINAASNGQFSTYVPLNIMSDPTDYINYLESR